MKEKEKKKKRKEEANVTFGIRTESLKIRFGPRKIRNPLKTLPSPKNTGFAFTNLII